MSDLPKNYTMIKNTIVEKLAKTHLSSYESQVVQAIIRKTYGFEDLKTGGRKTEDYIALSQLEELTGIKKPNLSRTLNQLITRKIVIRRDNKLGINKNTDLWLELSNGINNHDKKKLSRSITTVIPFDNASLSRSITTKENTTKETYTKEITTNVVSETAQIGESLGTNYFIGLFQSVNPSYKRLYANKTERAALERLLEQYGEDRLEQMIGLLPGLNQQKYAPTVTTPYQLEAKMGALQAFFFKESHGNNISIDTSKL